MNITTPFEPRLDRRYRKMVDSHFTIAQAVASGMHAVPDAADAMAHTQAAYRFLNNDRVTYRGLIAPLIEAARQAAAEACDSHLLIAHDWSGLMYLEHTSKLDRIGLSSRTRPEGYELLTALALNDRDGTPLAPVAMSLRAADGTHCTQSYKVRETRSPLDELGPTMAYLDKQNFRLPLMHIIDAEADSVDHYRQWNRAGHQFLVRADDRLLTTSAGEQRCSQIRAELRKNGRFRHVREVQHQGRTAQQYVAEAAVSMTRPAFRNRPNSGGRQTIPGEPLPLRLIIAEVRDGDELLAVWYLLSNAPPAIDDTTLARWYYWRWSIEQYFKLLKSGGLHVETWQQTSAAAILKRLLVASMACVTVWQLHRSAHPQAERARQILVRLSGRQMKYKVKHTLPALLAGMWVLLAMQEALETYTLEELQQAAALAFAHYRPNPP